MTAAGFYDPAAFYYVGIEGVKPQSPSGVTGVTGGVYIGAAP